MSVPLEAFKAGDVFIDYPSEEVLFHFAHETGVVFRKFYGDPRESEVPQSNRLFREAILSGELTSRERYAGMGLQSG